MELLNHLRAGRSQGSHPEQLGTGSPELDSHWIPAVIIIMICNKCNQCIMQNVCYRLINTSSWIVIVMKGNGLSYDTGVFLIMSTAQSLP